MIVLHITSVEFNDAGKRNWLLFEVEAETMKDVVDRLNGGELVYGCRLIGHRDKADPRTFIVTGASETTVIWDEVHRIQTPWWKLVKFEDVAA